MINFCSSIALNRPLALTLKNRVASVLQTFLKLLSPGKQNAQVLRGHSQHLCVTQEKSAVSPAHAGPGQGAQHGEQGSGYLRPPTLLPKCSGQPAQPTVYGSARYRHDYRRLAESSAPQKLITQLVNTHR